MKKFMVAVGSFIILLFLGLIYAWSIFATPLEAEYGWTRDQTSLTFTISISLFCIGGLVAAQLRNKIHISVILLINALLILAGFFLTSRLDSLWELYVYYGVICGFAVGSAYNCIISVIPLHYPKRVGFISGVMLLAFGFGGFILGSVAKTLMNAYGWSNAFLYIGLLFSSFLLYFYILSLLQK
jgi:OFA family oxalate/formate antiporter-like MFS transporter